MPRFTLTTLGCKVNQYDAMAVATMLSRAGLRRVENERDADLLVINTCCVTTTAMSKSRQAIRRAVRAAPASGVLVMGCYSSYNRRRVADVLADAHVPPDRACIVGHGDDLTGQIRRFLHRLQETTLHSGEFHLTGEQAGRSGNDKPITALPWGRTQPPTSPQYISSASTVPVKRNVHSRIGPIESFHGHTRAFVKVQDGCDAFCSYCIVPYCRRTVTYRPVDDVVDECRRLRDAGHPEVVLCGVFLGAYGRETAVRRRWTDTTSPLTELLAHVAEIDGLWRVRLSSLEPGDLTEDLLSVIREKPKVAPHLHLPLQSGSDAVLKRMNRQYRTGQYRDAVARLREALDRPALTTDIIVGFPGESRVDFDRTLEMVRDAGFAKVHAFPFSPIEGTAAWRYRHDAPSGEETRVRMDELRSVASQTAGAYRKQFVGDTLEGVVESSDNLPEGQRQAMTDRYLTVRFAPSDGEDTSGRVMLMAIDAAESETLLGRVVSMVAH
ncbi:MAG: MiaB/RimO family radical SAM methylthiotransferase [Phycisphaerae bacterium]